MSATVARFDVVAADNVSDEGGMEKVLAGLDDSWEAVMSRAGSFGFFYNDDQVQLVRELGTYPDKAQFARSPYGAQFRLSGTRFLFNIVICHIAAGTDQEPSTDEIANLASVYRYFEKISGDRGMTVLLAGGIENRYAQEIRSLLEGARSALVALDENLSGTGSLHDRKQRFFASAALYPRIEEVKMDDSTLPSAGFVLKVVDSSVLHPLSATHPRRRIAAGGSASRGGGSACSSLRFCAYSDKAAWARSRSCKVTTALISRVDSGPNQPGIPLIWLQEGPASRSVIGSRRLCFCPAPSCRTTPGPRSGTSRRCSETSRRFSTERLP